MLINWWALINWWRRAAVADQVLCCHRIPQFVGPRDD